jgi:molybdate transport system ATP-binding protein
MEEILIELHLNKKFHTNNGVEKLDVHLKIPKYGLITLFGKSGVGKTTILRIIAGLTRPDSGFIKVGDELWYDTAKNINKKPQQRNIGFVFQDYALFPNMTVKEHLLYASPQKETWYISELLDVFHLKGLCNRKPDKLSGGQQQRLAVARALARKPQILLLDEPLSALDSDMRHDLQNEIVQAHKNFHATTLLVSHDINEVTKLSDFVYVIGNGKIQKQGKPCDVFDNTTIQPDIQLVGLILAIENNILTVSVNNNITKILSTPDEIENLKINNKILITAKAINPTISKLTDDENH